MSLVAACGDDESTEDTGSDASGSADGSSSATASSTATDGSGSASNSGSATNSTSGSSGEDASGGETTGQPVSCGDTQCAPGEYCVAPCCGGPAPDCGPVDGTTCPDGKHEVDACPYNDTCQAGMLCCEDDPCVPPPAYCIPAAEADCEEFRCNGPCMGPLNDSVITCEDCA